MDSASNWFPIDTFPLIELMCFTSTPIDQRFDVNWMDMESVFQTDRRTIRLYRMFYKQQSVCKLEINKRM